MTRNPARRPTHPGAILREDILPAVGEPKAKIAALLGISRQHLYDILREKKPVTPETAVKLAAMFGGSAETWVRLQGAYDTFEALQTVDVSAIPALHAKAA
jgi:antitoxin HigA-1